MLEKLTLAYRRMSLRVFDWFDHKIRYADSFRNKFARLGILACIFSLVCLYCLISIPFLVYFNMRRQYFQSHPEVRGQFWTAPNRTVDWGRGGTVFPKSPTVEKVNWKRDGF